MGGDERSILESSSCDGTCSFSIAGVASGLVIEAIKAVAKNLFGVDPVEAKAAREREPGKGLTGDEEIRAYEEETSGRSAGTLTT